MKSSNKLTHSIDTKIGWKSFRFSQSPLSTPLDDSDDETIATAPETDSESDSDFESDAETIVASNCSPQSSDTEGAGEGVLKSQSRGIHVPGLSLLASSVTLCDHNIS